MHTVVPISDPCARIIKAFSKRIHAPLRSYANIIRTIFHCIKPSPRTLLCAAEYFGSGKRRVNACLAYFHAASIESLKPVPCFSRKRSNTLSYAMKRFHRIFPQRLPSLPPDFPKILRGFRSYGLACSFSGSFRFMKIFPQGFHKILCYNFRFILRHALKILRNALIHHILLRAFVVVQFFGPEPVREFLFGFLVGARGMHEIPHRAVVAVCARGRIG